MRKPVPCLYLLLVLLVLTLSCQQVEDLLTFNFTDEASFTVPSAIGVSVPYSVPTPEVKTTATTTFENNNTDAGKVKDIKLQTLTLSITSPASATFRPLKSIRIFIKANGLEEKLLAHMENIPTDVGNTLVLDTTKENLDAYVKGATYDIRTEVITRQTLLEDTSIKALMTFRVTANL